MITQENGDSRINECGLMPGFSSRIAYESGPRILPTPSRFAPPAEARLSTDPATSCTRGDQVIEKRSTEGIATALSNDLAKPAEVKE